MSWVLSSAAVDMNYLALASSGSGQYLATMAAPAGNEEPDASRLYLSSDFGAIWTVNNDLPVDLYKVVTSSDSGQTMATCSLMGIYTSDDFGSTWALSPNTTVVAESCNSFIYTPALVSSASGQYLYTATESSGLYRSSDAGATWSRSIGSSSSYTYKSISSSPSGQYVAATAMVDGKSRIFLSLNYGANYLRTLATVSSYQSNDIDYTWLVCADNGDIIVFAGNYLYKGTDIGQRWTKLEGLVGLMNSVSVDMHTSSTIIVGLSGNSVFQSPDGGENWYGSYKYFTEGSSVIATSTAMYDNGSVVMVGTNGNGIFVGKNMFPTSGATSAKLSGDAIFRIGVSVLAATALLSVMW